MLSIKQSKKKHPQWDYNHHDLSQLDDENQEYYFYLYLLTNPSELKKQFIYDVPYFWCHHKIGKYRYFEIYLNELNNNYLYVRGFPYVDNLLLFIDQSCKGNFKIIAYTKDLYRILYHHGNNRKLISIHVFDETLELTNSTSTSSTTILKNKKIEIKSAQFKQFKRLLYRKNYYKNETETFMNATRITNWDIAEVNQSRLVLKTLLVAKNDVKGKEDFVRMANCVYQYLGKVAEYERQYKLDSTPYYAIKWYTKQGFYYRLVNNTLKAGKGNPLLLAYIRFPVKQLYTSIKSLYISRKLHTQSFECYRGGRISQAYLEYFRKNIHGFIYMQGFLSCSKSKKYMYEFIVNCVFKITVNNLYRDPYCDHGFCILDDKYLTEYVKYEEVLFNVFCVMYIKGVAKEFIKNKEVDVISLEYGSLASLLYQKRHNLVLKNREYSEKCIDNYLALKPYYDSIKSQVDCFRFFGKFKEVELYYLTLMKHLSKHNEYKDSIKYMNVYYSLGYNSLSLQNYSQAKDYLIKARDIIESPKTQHDDYLLLARIYNGLGIANKNMNKLIYAKYNYLKTIKLIEKKRNKHGKVYLATAYNNLALILMYYQQYGSALYYYQKAITLLEGKYTYTTANIHYNLGQYYLSKSQYKYSIKNLSKSLYLYTKLFGTHKYTINCHIKLGYAYLKSNSTEYNKHFNLAMDMMKNLAFHYQSDYIKMKREIEELKRGQQLKGRRAISGVDGCSGEDVFSFLNKNQYYVKRYLSSGKLTNNIYKGGNNINSSNDSNNKYGTINFPPLGRNFHSQQNSLSKFSPININNSNNNDINLGNIPQSSIQLSKPSLSNKNSLYTMLPSSNSGSNNNINVGGFGSGAYKLSSFTNNNQNNSNNNNSNSSILNTIGMGSSNFTTNAMIKNNMSSSFGNNSYLQYNNKNTNNYSNNNNTTQQQDKLRQLRGKNLLDTYIPTTYDSYNLHSSNNSKSRYSPMMNNDVSLSPPYLNRKYFLEPPVYQDMIDQKLASFNYNDFISNLKLGRQKKNLIFG